MKSPSDGWDPDEREVLESVEMGRQLDAVRARHSLGPEDEARLLARIQQDTRASKARPAVRWWRWAVPITAAAGILIVATIVLRRDRDNTTGTAGTAPERTIAAASPAPVFYLPLDKPAIKISPSALAWRGPGGQNPLLADLKPAFDAFRANDYERADREFSALSAKYPTSIEIAFHQGVARLFVGNVQGAIASLTAAEALADRSFAWDVAWYRAIAEERAGQVADARARLTRLCAEPDSRAKTACDALAGLPGGRLHTP